jgi:hypothetical protein
MLETQVVDVAFVLAPDGKWRGMKMKRTEVTGTLKSLVVKGKIFLVNAVSSSASSAMRPPQPRYSSFPIAQGLVSPGGGGGGAAAGGGGANEALVVGGMAVPPQELQWPCWPTPAVVRQQARCKAALEEHLKAQSSEGEAAGEAGEGSEEVAALAADAEAAAAAEVEANRRRGTREVGPCY